MVTEYLKKAVDWFIKEKSKDIGQSAINYLEKINRKEDLQENEKKALGFILFTYTMHLGPTSFIQAEITATESGLKDQFMFYADDWIKYSNSKHKDQFPLN